MNATHSLGTIGHCIYCGATESGLSKEHIVPMGLGGIWVLQRASCQRCRNITSSFELDVLRHTLLPVRAKMNLRTRHKNKRPKEISLIVEKGQQQQTINVPIIKRPTVMILPRFSSPAYISKQDYKKDINLNGLYIYPFKAPSFQEFGRELGVDSVIDTVTYRGFKGGFSFARMLAKMAYGFAVAHFGFIIFNNNYVLPSILGQSNEIGKWVGSVDRSLSLTNNLHEIKLSVEDHDIYVYIRLFAKLGDSGPEYMVVVGHAPMVEANRPTEIQFNC